MNLDVKFYLSLFLRRIHYFLLIALAVSAIGLTIAATLPPVYRADARLIVESEQIPSNLAASTVRTSTVEQIQIISQRLLTRPNLLDLADRLDVYGDRSGMDPDFIVNDMRSRVQFGTSGGSRRNPGATTITIGFRDQDPQMAAAVTNELVTLLLEEDVEFRTGIAGQTREFFEQEVARLDEELRIASEALLQFQSRNLQTLPSNLNFLRSRQTALQERIAQINRERAALQERRTRLVEMFEATGEIAEFDGVPATPEQAQLNNLRRELSDALVIYSDQNPRVQLLQNRISALEAAVAQQVGATSEDGTELSPVELQLADIDSQIAILDAEAGQVETGLQEVAALIEAVPETAVSMGTLERDVDAIRNQYNQAVGDLAQANMGDRIEALSKGQRVTVIDQATVPRSPVSPDRERIAMLSVMMGVGLGAAFIVLLELLNRSIRRPDELTAKLGITPFATLPYVRSAGQALRRRILIGSAFATVIIGIPLTLWALHTYYLPMDLLMERAAEELGIDGVIEQVTNRLS